MSDFERMKKCFDEIGVDYSVKEINSEQRGVYIYIHIRTYSGGIHFYFTKEGVFTDCEIYEG